MKLITCGVSTFDDKNEAVIFYWNEFVDDKFQQRCYKVEVTRDGITAGKDFTEGTTAENKESAWRYFDEISEEFFSAMA